MATDDYVDALAAVGLESVAVIMLGGKMSIPAITPILPSLRPILVGPVQSDIDVSVTVSLHDILVFTPGSSPGVRRKTKEKKRN